MNNKNRLALCELHYTPVHGKTSESCATIESHYLLIATFKPTEQNIAILSNLDVEDSDSETSETDVDLDEQQNEICHMQSVMRMYRRQYDRIVAHPIMLTNYPHKTIRNYKAIVSRKDYIQLEIVQYIVLITRETVVIKKTFWLRVVQRTWKKVFGLRKNIVNSLQFILNYQLQGNYSNKVPSIRGMLWYLRK